MTKKHFYQTSGVCAPRIEFEIDSESRIHNVKFHGGCAGNSKAVTALVEGLKTDDVIEKLSGIYCRNQTSCPDQLARALKKIKTEQN